MTAPALTNYAQGSTQVSADQLNTFEQTCDNFAQLRTLTGVTGMQVSVRGAVTPSDGGGGEFWWNPNNTAADDNATVIVPGGVTLGGWNLLTITAAMSRWVEAGGYTITGTVTYEGAVTYEGVIPKIDGAAGTTRMLAYATGGATAWQTGAETSASNYQVQRFVGGVYYDSPLTVLASTGVAQFIQPPTMPNAAAAQNPTTLAQFAATLSATGSQALPGGLLIQWGTFTSSNSADTAVTFPTTFSAAGPYVIQTTPQVSGGGVMTGYNTPSATGFSGNAWSSNNTRIGSITVMYFAIGHTP